MNKVIVAELKKRLGEAKGAWVDELSQILWAYQCTPHGTTWESPFNLTYGTNAMLPVEVGEPTLRREMQGLDVGMATGQGGDEFRYPMPIPVKKIHPHPHTQIQRVSKFYPIPISTG